jgi:hypothetical protein
MNTLPLVSADWLALRARADDAARSPRLAAAAARLIGPGPLVVHDLGSGTGAMMRWLAPQLPGPQAWVLHDADPTILRHVDARSALDGFGFPITVRTRFEQLAELPVRAFAGASLVTASALFDVVTHDEARAVVDACVASGVPALFSLTVVGRVRLSPHDAADTAIGAAFDDHQRRVVDGRRLLGPDGGETIRSLFTAAGWRVRTAQTPWRLGADSGQLITEWLDGWLGAAVEQRPELLSRLTDYRVRRDAEIARDKLRVTVQHQDVLAWPR